MLEVVRWESSLECKALEQRSKRYQEVFCHFLTITKLGVMFPSKQMVLVYDLPPRYVQGGANDAAFCGHGGGWRSLAYKQTLVRNGLLDNVVYEAFLMPPG